MQLTRCQRRRFYPVLTAAQENDFWRHVTRGDDDACWPWPTWQPIIEPLPTFYLCHHGDVNAARIAYWLWYGVQPGLSNVLHSCKNPCCCNPLHLYLRMTHDKGQ
jgi:hypothetical protein